MNEIAIQNLDQFSSLKNFLESDKSYRLKETGCTISQTGPSPEMPSIDIAFERNNLYGPRSWWLLYGGSNSKLIDSLASILSLPDTWYTTVYIQTLIDYSGCLFQRILPLIRGRQICFENYLIGALDAMTLANVSRSGGKPIRISFQNCYFWDRDDCVASDLMFVEGLRSRKIGHTEVAIAHFEWNGGLRATRALLEVLESRKLISTLCFRRHAIPGDVVARVKVDRLIIDPMDLDDAGSALLRVLLEERSPESFQALHLVHTDNTTPMILPSVFILLPRLRLKELGIGFEVPLFLAEGFRSGFANSRIRALNILAEAQIPLESWKVMMDGIAASRSLEQLEIDFPSAIENDYVEDLVELLQKNRRIELGGFAADPRHATEALTQVVSLNRFIRATRTDSDLGAGLVFHSLVLHLGDLRRTGVMLQRHVHHVTEAISSLASIPSR